MTILPSIIGMIGAAMILTAYLLLQIGKMTTEGLWYTIVNLVGSLMILFSLFFDFNLPALFIEVVWITVSVIALARHFARNHRNRHERGRPTL
ncbi:MAG TPA: hypothetical protein PKK50_02515 [Myxococcota bacterium]|nr:hypothetical protein [Myxococcota bacterium]